MNRFLLTIVLSLAISIGNSFIHANPASAQVVTAAITDPFTPKTPSIQNNGLVNVITGLNNGSGFKSTIDNDGLSELAPAGGNAGDDFCAVVNTEKSSLCKGNGAL